MPAAALDRSLPRPSGPRPSPFLALARVATGGPSAAEPLLRWLLAHPWRLPSGPLGEDLLHDVAVRLVERAPSLAQRLAHPPETADGRLTAYVAAMLRNAWADHRRRPKWVPLEPHSLVTFPDPGLLLDLRATARAVDHVRERLPGHVDSLDQLEALARGETSMGDLVDRTRRPGEARNAARDRLYMRHRRAREALERELSRLEKGGGLGSDLREHASAFVRRWLRRRRA